MWSPINTFARTALRFTLLTPLLLLVSCAGYGFAPDSPSVLGDGTATLKVKGVDYPTLQPWLPYALRSALRNEINARHLAVWVDDGYADYEMQIKVISYTTHEWARSEDDVTVLYDTSMTIEATLYDKSNKEVWRSGRISYGDRVENPQEKAAAGDILVQIMRRLADKLRTTF